MPLRPSLAEHHVDVIRRVGRCPEESLHGYVSGLSIAHREADKGTYAMHTTLGMIRRSPTDRLRRDVNYVVIEGSGVREVSLSPSDPTVGSRQQSGIFVDACHPVECVRDAGRAVGHGTKQASLESAGEQLTRKIQPLNDILVELVEILFGWRATEPGGS